MELIILTDTLAVSSAIKNGSKIRMLSCLAETIRHINSEGSVSALFLDNDNFI